jgi:ribosomal protein S18 acetylase RimI-like enzyme
MGEPRNNQIRKWLLDVAIARSQRQIDVPGGIAVLHEKFPQAHDHNRLLESAGDDAAALAAAADAVLGGAGLAHRQIAVDSNEVADRLADGLAQHGYERSDELVMTYDAGVPPEPAAIEITELDLAQRSAAATADWRQEQPDWAPDVAVALGERTRTLVGAVEPTFLAIRDGERILARADLYLRAGIAQVEEVMTDEAARRRGYASALVREATRRAMQTRAELVFLIADAEDGAAPLYRRLGFADAFRTASFAR